MSESFPCIICGKHLERVAFFGHEGQPSDGIMCETNGNYGSTVFDRESGEYLAFNICDPCMVQAGAAGRVMTYQKFRLIILRESGIGPLVVGREMLRRPYIPWHVGIEPDMEPLYMSLDELRTLPEHCKLHVTIQDIEAMIESGSQGSQTHGTS